ncbi:MAG: DUF4124 domain-containing protein [Proteobacteria bacterium]|nr:DUF4124 domain-containing protein [Pseudomonadota bacterium]
MKIRSLFIINLILVTLVTAETVYKTVDEEGNSVFSDKPTEGAEVIEIKEARTISFPETKSFDYTSSKKKQSGVQYTRLVITHPRNDSTIQNNSGNVTISVYLEPSLRSGHSIVITMDGNEISNGSASSASVDNVDRGAHNIVASVVSEEGEKLISTSSNFSLLRASQ